MADNYDGELKFKTSLDTDGFSKGAKKLKKESKEIQEEVKKASSVKTSASDLNTKKTEKALDDISKKAEEAKRSIEDMGAEIKEVGGSEMKGAVEAMEAVSQKAKEATQSVSELNKAVKKGESDAGDKIVVLDEPDTEGFERGSDRMEAAVDSAIGTFEELGNKMEDALFGALDKPISDTEHLSDKAGELSDSLDGVKDGIEGIGDADGIPETTGQVEELSEQVEELGDQDGVTVECEATDADSTSEDLGEVADAAEDAGERIEEAEEAISDAGDIDVSDAVDGLEKASEKAEETRDAISEAMEEASSQTGEAASEDAVIKPEVDTDNVTEGISVMEAAAGAVESAFEGVEEAVSSAFDAVYSQPIPDEVLESSKAVANAQFTQDKEPEGGSEEPATSAFDKTAETTDKIKENIEDVKKEAESVGEAVGSAAESASDSVSSATDNINDNVSSSAENAKEQAKEAADSMKESTSEATQGAKGEGAPTEEGAKESTGNEIQFGKPVKAVNTFSSAVKGVQSDLKEMGELAKKAIEGDEEALDKYIAKSAETNAKIEEMRQQLEKFGNTKFETDASKVLAENYAKAAEEVQRLAEKLAEAQQTVLELRQAFEMSEEVKSLEEAAAKYREMADAYKAADGDSEKQEGIVSEMSEQVQPQEGVDFSETLIQAAEQVEQKLQEMRESFDNSEEMQKTTEEVEKTEQELEEAKEKAEDLKTAMEAEADKSFMGSESTEYQKDAEALDNLTEKAQEYDDQVADAAAKKQDPYGYAWNQAIGSMNNAKSAATVLQGTFSNVFSTIAAKVGTVTGTIAGSIKNPWGALGNVLVLIGRNAASAAPKLMSLAGGAVLKGIKGLASHAKQAATNLASMAKSTITSGLAKLKSAIGGVNKNMIGSNLNFKKGFTTVLRYAFGIRSIFAAIRKLRSAIIEGVGNVEKYDMGFKDAVEDFQLSLTTLKNAVGAAVAPIAQMVLPVITRIIDSITEAVNHVGMLTSALTGKQQYIKASKAQAKAYQQEEKAAKEAQKTIAGFDDLTILQDNNEDNNGDKDKQENPGFETVPIDNDAMNLADKLKDMWQKADFTDLGRMLGEKIRDALNSIPWDEIKAVLRKIAHSIATFLNGFFETPGLFDAIGRTLAQILNSIFEFLNEFVHTLHWDSIGKAITEGILGFLNNIDWPLIQDTFLTLGQGLAQLIGEIVSDPELPGAIGQALANVLNTAFLFVYGFVSTFPWGDLGTFIKNGIMGFLDGIDWELIYETMRLSGEGIGTALENAIDDPNLWSKIFTAFSNAIRALFTAIYGFVSTPNWGSIGANIGNGLNDGVETFPWDLISQTLVTAINGCLDFLYNFITTFDFKTFGEKIGTFISDSIGGINWNEFGAVIGSAISGLLSFFSGLVGSVNWWEIGKSIVDTIAGFFGSFQWSTVGELLGNLITGLFNFISGVIQNVDWLSLPSKIIDAIAGFLGGVDWFKLLTATFNLLGTAFIGLVQLLVGAGGAILKAGVMIIQGFFKGIGKLPDVFKWLKENVFDRIVKGIKDVFGIASPAKTMLPLGANVITGFLNGILNPLKSIGSFLKNNVAGPVINGVKKFFGVGQGTPALQSSGQGTIEGFKKGVSDKMSSITGWLSNNITGPITKDIKKGFGTDGTPVTKSDGTSLIDGLKDGMSNGSNGIDSWTEKTVADPVKHGVEDPLGINGKESSVFNEYGEGVVGSLTDGMEGEASGLESFMGSNVASPVTGGIESNFGIQGGSSSVFDGYGNAMITSMRSGMEQSGTLVSDYASAIAEATQNAFTSQNWTSIGSDILSGLYNGLIDGWDWAYTAVTDIASNLLQGAKDALGIASPSKAFYWVAEMITKGLTNGLDDTGGDAVRTIGDIAEAVTQEAQATKPELGISTAVDGSLSELDATMNDFTSRVVTGFERMIAQLQDIVKNAGLVIPQTALGAITPYASRVADAGKNAKPDMETLMELIAAQNSDKLTKQDLREVMTEIAREYFQFDFYLGDEQVARSANRGNARLDRRYSPVRS